MKMPPFAKHLDSGAPEIWIYVGTGSWNSAKFRNARRLPVLLLPPDQAPEQFRWPVDGKAVLLIQQGRYDIQRIPAFANLLFGCGASVIRAIYSVQDNPDDGETPVRVVYYRRGNNVNAV